MSEQNGVQNSVLQRPTNDDKVAWNAYWKSLGQPWRWKPEIDTERQQFLDERRKMQVDWSTEIFPFENIHLNRADVEWLLATHEDGRGPVDWNDESQRVRDGLYLCRADLSHENLGGLPLAKSFLRLARLEGAYLFMAHLQEADLVYAQLQKAVLLGAELEGANLSGAQLEKTDLIGAWLQGSNLVMAEIQRANLYDVSLANEHGVGPQLADVQWGDTNLAVVDWEPVATLGDEHKARQKLDENGKEKDKGKRRDEYKVAARAYRQLSVALRNQGLNEDAARFAYRGQLMQRKFFWYQRQFVQYLGSLFLDLLSGYGYRVGRCFIAYALVGSVYRKVKSVRYVVSNVSVEKDEREGHSSAVCN